MSNPFGGLPFDKLQQLPPGADPLEFGILQTTKSIEAEIEKHGWDQPHMLWVVTRVSADVGQGAAAFGFGMTFAAGIPAELSGDPARAVRNLADDPTMLKALLTDRGIEAESIQAWVFVTEAWMVVPEDDSPEAAARLTEQAEARQLHAHPRRIEVRTVSAVDRAERLYMVTRTRGQLDDQRMSHVDSAGQHWLGAIPASVLALTQATP